MYGKPFNEKRPFGEAKGDPRFHYEQDGQVYNALKQPVDMDGRLMPLPPADEPKAPAEDNTVIEQTQPENPDDDIPEDEKPFDILAWAQGDETLKSTPFAKVKAETARLVEDMTGITSKDTARKAILAHYGLATQ